MNAVTKDELLTRVKEDWINLNKNYKTDDRALLGIFVVQKANFGFAKKSSDIDTLAVIIPSLEEIAVGTSPTQGAYLMHREGGRIYLENFLRLFDDYYNPNSYVKEIFYTPYFYINPYYQKIFSQLQINTEKQTDINRHRLVVSEDPLSAEQLTNVLTQILKQSLEINIGVQEDLFKALTKKEEEALTFVLNTIGDEGNISISEAIKKSKISRPVFTSLFEKLDRYRGAEIRNMGVKGTYINFYDHVLSRFEQN